jgi:hypothetical protein
MALRAAGRLSDRIRMLPECGAGTFVTLIAGIGALEYAHRCIGRRSSRWLGRRKRGMFACLGVTIVPESGKGEQSFQLCGSI